MIAVRLLKSVLVGTAAAFVAALITVLAQIALGIRGIGGSAVVTGSGGLGAVSMPVYFLYAALIAFGLGFFWQFKRSRVKRQRATRR